MGWVNNLFGKRQATSGTQVLASLMLDTARAKGYLESEALSIVPELLGNEERIIAYMNHLIEERIQQRGTLPFKEVHCLFLYAVCRGYEAAYHWQVGDEYDIKPDGMFDGRVSCQVSFELAGQLKTKPLADDLFLPFQQWCMENPGFAAENKIHNLLPLQTCLQYAYRIAMHQALCCLGY